MPDITDRLRHFQKVFKGPNFAKAYHDMGDEIGQAADEIERLRATLREIADSSNDPRAVREARAVLREAKI